jgi:S-adenosylmethionine synthetase
MFEKVNPAHPDKVADRIAGAIVDIAYSKRKDSHIAVEVLLGHGKCHVIIETDTTLSKREVKQVVSRIAGKCRTSVKIVPQDMFLALNQLGDVKCGDNGIFKGTPVTNEQKQLSKIAREIYAEHPTDGKYIMDGKRLVICQSNVKPEDLVFKYPTAEINPLGSWSGGTDVDTGATNRKLWSDMGDAVTGGGLHGKDLSKADVTLNIYAHLLAQERNKPVQFSCAISDTEINGTPYSEIVEIARTYIDSIGGFEKFAEWGLI